MISKELQLFSAVQDEPENLRPLIDFFNSQSGLQDYSSGKNQC